MAEPEGHRPVRRQHRGRARLGHRRRHGLRRTTKETRNTGLPRFDRLLAKARRQPPDERDLIIVAPTWRQWLTEYTGPGRAAARDPRALLDVGLPAALGRRPPLADGSPLRPRGAGWRVAFMPHPNMQPILRADGPPSRTSSRSTSTAATSRTLYARCALLVTDYSSVAFNVAYIDGPVVYFQFDRDDVLGGAHLGRQGYFDYERDGFGPVATDLDGAIDAIVEAIEHGPTTVPRRTRRASTPHFPTATARLAPGSWPRSRTSDGPIARPHPPA